MKIENYKNINELKSLDNNELVELASSIRQKLIDLSKNKKIHLSSNLGVVELTISLLKNFNLPLDKINYDTGHQCYIHKILTDRNDLIDSIRDENGISGFPDNNESVYDFISTGHSSNSLSISQGYIENKNDQNYLVTVIGDAAISNGLSFEALNNISYNKTKMIIVLNDNGMSISKNTGALYQAFSKMKNTNFSFGLEKIMINSIGQSKFGKKVCYSIFNFFNKLEKFFFGKNIFQSLNMNYIGPINGHNLNKLDKAIQRAKWYSNKGPVILHVKTNKGFGLDDTKINDPAYHSIKLNSNVDDSSFSYNVAKKLFDVLINNNDIKIINSAMTYSVGTEQLEKNFPYKYEDVGINEEHSVSKSCGIYFANKKPIVMLYSTFLQRTYDQIHHDIARLRIPAIFLLDRCDISSSDGDTHHGIYDVGMLKSIPNTIIATPSNTDELNELIDLAIANEKDPFFIRYTNRFSNYENSVKEKIKIGTWKIIQNKKSKSCVISYGDYVNVIKDKFNNLDVDIINAIFQTIKKEDYILDMIKNYKKIYFYERIYNSGTIYNDVISIINKYNLKIECKLYCFNKAKIGIGTEDSINKKTNMDLEYLYRDIKKDFNRKR